MAMMRVFHVAVIIASIVVSLLAPENSASAQSYGQGVYGDGTYTTSDGGVVDGPNKEPERDPVNKPASPSSSPDQTHLTPDVNDVEADDEEPSVDSSSEDDFEVAQPDMDDFEEDESLAEDESNLGGLSVIAILLAIALVIAGLTVRKKRHQ